MRNYHARFWRAAALVRESLTLIENAAVNILERALTALSAVGLMVPARGGQGDAQPMKRETSWTTLTGSQLSLF